MPADVLITGASGFVGSAVARALCCEGFRVRALVRERSPRGHVSDLGLEFVEGDLRDGGAVRAAMDGVRFFFHIAADYRLSLRSGREVFHANVDGTRIAMNAARRAGVERAVYTSSVATLAIRPGGESSDESELSTRRAAIGAYKKSKLAAEELVLDSISKGLPAVIVNPSTPIGPRDVKPTPTGRIIIEAALGRMPGYVDTGLNVVHVDDVAAGHIAALRKGKIGERYILGGENIAFLDLLKAVAELAGVSPPRWRVPGALVWPVAIGAEVSACFSGREPFATINGLRMARHKMYFTSTKAERDLGYRSRPYREALADSINWFGSAGMLR